MKPFDDHVPLPALINQDIDARLAELEGWHRRIAQQHRQRLILAHAFGRHTEVIEGCPECATNIGLWLMRWYELPRDVRRMFE